MNPDMWVWNALKDDRLANHDPTSLDELEGTVRREIPRLKRDPQKVFSAMRQTELLIEELLTGTSVSSSGEEKRWPIP